MFSADFHNIFMIWAINCGDFFQFGFYAPFPHDLLQL